jgi:hypothetical protein
MKMSTKKIEMTFACDQDWNDMKISGLGRHCEVCRKTVIDYSAKSIDQIAMAGNRELCGMFRVEQIEPDLHPIKAPFSLRTTLITLGAVLGLELSQVHGQELEQRPKIENVVDKDSSRTATAPAATRLEDKVVRHQDCGDTKPRIRRKYYFTKRFPFIVKRRTRTVGRFRF